MRIFGITGGSGSGKSTVSSLLREMGVDIIDGDELAREVTQKGSRCLEELAEAFGEGIFLADGSLNRKKLAQAAFSDSKKTELLNSITHKYIKSEAQRRIASSKAELIGIDGAVIIGSPVEELCEKIVLVTADAETRIARIKSRDSLTDEEARTRINAQPDEEFYKKHSDYIIDNSGGADSLKDKVRKLRRSMMY